MIDQKTAKKVFVPMSDELLSSKVAVQGELVPFSPDFLVVKEDRKPANWIAACDVEVTRARLRANRAR